MVFLLVERFRLSFWLEGWFRVRKVFEYRKGWAFRLVGFWGVCLRMWSMYWFWVGGVEEISFL